MREGKPQQGTQLQHVRASTSTRRPFPLVCLLVCKMEWEAKLIFGRFCGKRNRIRSTFSVKKTNKMRGNSWRARARPAIGRAKKSVTRTSCDGSITDCDQWHAVRVARAQRGSALIDCMLANVQPPALPPAGELRENQRPLQAPLTPVLPPASDAASGRISLSDEAERGVLRWAHLEMLKNGSERG